MKPTVKSSAAGLTFVEKATIIDEARRLNGGNFRTKKHYGQLREFALGEPLHIKITDAVLSQLFAAAKTVEKKPKPAKRKKISVRVSCHFVARAA